MTMALSGRGLFVAGATLLLSIGSIALVGAVGAASAPAGAGLGPPVLVQSGTATSAGPGTVSPTPSTHAEDQEHTGEATVVGPIPAHEVEADHDVEHQTTRPPG